DGLEQFLLGKRASVFDVSFVGLGIEGHFGIGVLLAFKTIDVLDIEVFRCGVVGWLNMPAIFPGAVVVIKIVICEFAGLEFNVFEVSGAGIERTAFVI